MEIRRNVTFAPRPRRRKHPCLSGDEVAEQLLVSCVRCHLQRSGRGFPTQIKPL